MLLLHRFLLTLSAGFGYSNNRVITKNSASKRNESKLSNCRAQPVLLKKTFLLSSWKSVYGPAENIVRTDMKSHARKSGQLFWFM